MSYAVYLKRSAEKELDLLPKEVYNRIVKQLVFLKDDPRPRGKSKIPANQRNAKSLSIHHAR